MILNQLERAQEMLKEEERSKRKRLKKIKSLLSLLDHDFEVPVLLQVCDPRILKDENYLCKVEDCFVHPYKVQLDVVLYATSIVPVRVKKSTPIRRSFNLEDINSWKPVLFNEFPLYVNFPYKTDKFLELFAGGER